MPTNRVPTEEIVAAYRETGSVWKAAKRLGITGQSVHSRLVGLGFQRFSSTWTDEEVSELRTLVEAGVPLGEVAGRLGRPYAGVASKASQLGIRSVRTRERKVPRASGYDKASMKQHIVALWRYQGTITQYARANSLNVDPFVKAFQRHFPAAWDDYTKLKGVGPQATCPYCEDKFYPMSAKQQFCTRKCAGDARRDKAYFGGNRRYTVGLKAGVCQLCGGERQKGLSSHHVLGKENDPENEVLVALCPGCHQLVTRLSSRNFADDPTAWEALISLVWMRRNPDKFREPDTALYVEVEIEFGEDYGQEAEEARDVAA